MKTQARVVVIGGGAVGAACLYHLARAGVTDALLLEKDELTSGSTWHAAGNIPTYANSWLGMRAGNYAWQLYKDLEDTLGVPITYRHTGAFWPAHTAERMDWYQHVAGVSRSAGFDLAMLTPAEMESLHPHYRAGKSVIGAIHDPYEGDIDPSQLTQALGKGARDLGATIERFTEVTGITRRNGEWQVATNKGDIRCEIIVNASGFYGNRIAGFVDQQVPIATLEHQYLVTEPLPELVQDKTLFPLVRDPDIRFYLRREGAGFLFGSYGHEGRLAFKDGLPNAFAHSLFEDSPDDIVELIEQAIDHIPLLANAGVQRFVNGPIGYTPDALPLCGPAAGLPNFYHACGIQIGITHSAAVGKAITEWITEGETEWDYAAWDPRRFGDWADKTYTEDRIVELYDLQYAIPYPHRILQSGRPVQRTSLYQTLADKGAVFGQIAGWERAFWFDTHNSNQPEQLSMRNDESWRAAVAQECRNVRDHVGIMDHGGFTKYEVSGVDASAFLDNVFCSSLPKVGRVKLSYMLTDNGRLWSEATIARLDDNRYLLCGPTLADQRDFDWLNQHATRFPQVKIQRGSDHNAALMIMGPGSRALLSQLTDANLAADAMPWMSAAEFEVAGINCIALRVSYVGELGWELHLPDSALIPMNEAICRVGADLNLCNFGSWALNSMRIEKAYHGWGADFGAEYTPYDAGLGRFINWNKPDFVGREALLSLRDKNPEWRFVHLTVDAPHADPLPGDPIICNGDCVGYVSSGGYGFRIDSPLALGYVQSDVSLDAELTVQVLGMPCTAQRCASAFYDPDNERLKS
jgi:dimethylglycine dehydrogenase